SPLPAPGRPAFRRRVRRRAGDLSLSLFPLPALRRHVFVGCLLPASHLSSVGRGRTAVPARGLKTEERSTTSRRVCPSLPPPGLFGSNCRDTIAGTARKQASATFCGRVFA